MSWLPLGIGILGFLSLASCWGPPSCLYLVGGYTWPLLFYNRQPTSFGSVWPAAAALEMNFSVALTENDMTSRAYNGTVSRQGVKQRRTDALRNARPEIEALGGKCFLDGDWLFAHLLTVTFHHWLRPAEALTLQWCCVVPICTEPLTFGLCRIGNPGRKSPSFQHVLMNHLALGSFFTRLGRPMERRSQEESTHGHEVSWRKNLPVCLAFCAWTS